MRLNFFLKHIRLVLFILALIITIPLIIVWGIFQSQDIRNKAAEPPVFPNVDLNNDGVINNIDLKIYQEKFAPQATP